MKKLLLILMAGLLFSGTGFSQAEEKPEDPKPWTKGGMGGLTFNQVGLFNWAAGGNSNMTLIGNLNLFANYKQGTSTWENKLDLAYGFIQNFRANTVAREVPGFGVTKAEDKIDFISKYGKKAWSEKVYYTGLLNFRTQFAPGFASARDTVYISKFLAPGYIEPAIGLDFKPKDWLSVFVSPVSGKVTIVADTLLARGGAFGVNQRDETGAFLPGNSEQIRVEFGATVRATFKKDIFKNVGLESNLTAFSNYIDRPGNIDWRWTNALVAKLNKYITVNFFTDLIYDHDIKIGAYTPEGLPADAFGQPVMVYTPTGNLTDNPANPINSQWKGPRTQFKEVFGLGFSYKF